ncbi:uncharacterized protein LACBIDRAFT_300481 [Laccaria bicolor S238N-H82]|uniref:Predicted protein n=1 Tax=Laccaria bicolor (strain S238N-H82 / ATCC MYA-4686) TaxID=486041 RepID=B0DGV9_LACBS|nr:uncharacterized protein LACBIDRAFT_300481 [Laccaria bicolor S238N-H82]EDR06216.1 predicted protein [Laccaria bicolor S238N-H82]|eukprot:XP_001883077.1 predicted protein [Laccaria bicolor S238N-H82]
MPDLDALQKVTVLGAPTEPRLEARSGRWLSGCEFNSTVDIAVLLKLLQHSRRRKCP